jgi:polar amino acid transport system permease protein
MSGILGFLIDGALLEEYGWRLLAGLAMTAKVVGLSCSIGFVLAWPICWARMSRSRILSGLALCYVMVFRGTPVLCQLYLVYYGAGELRPSLEQVGLWSVFRDAFFCCMFAFSLNTAAYQSEIYRGALAAVPKGQREAAAALGLSRWQILRRVVIPQACLVALRPLGNELIGMIKASALAAIVTLLDLMGQTRFIFARTFDMSVYLYAALLYLALTEAIRRIWLVMERRLSPHLVTAQVATAQPQTQSAKVPEPALAAAR